MTEVRLACEVAPGAVANEDYAFAVPGFVGVLDGVTVPAGMDTGCIHGTTWYVRTLAGFLVAAYAATPDKGIPELLAEAITEVKGAHGGHCDLNHPGTPASTVCLARYGPEGLDYLVLCDSPLVYEQGGQVEVITDLRLRRTSGALRERALAGAAIGTAQHETDVRNLVTAQRKYINSPGGYWIAAAEPFAAQHAVTGCLPLTGDNQVTRAMLLTDGASRAVDTFELCDWPGALNTATEHGPGYVIEQVRAAERRDKSGHARPRYKRHDDASILLILFGEGAAL